jgi:hypothetical protein
MKSEYHEGRRHRLPRRGWSPLTSHPTQEAGAPSKLRLGGVPAGHSSC